jgi:hypothetical protein
MTQNKETAEVSFDFHGNITGSINQQVAKLFLFKLIARLPTPFM